jgi:hypothetical protein
MQAFLRLLLLPLALLALTLPALAQGNEDDYDFSEIPVEEEEIPYIGVGGGYQLQMVLLNLDELNALVGSLGIPEFSGGLFMHGGGGWTAIGIVPNLRVGVFGGGGSKEQSAEDTTGGGTRRSLQFINGFTAALIDYAITPFARFTIAPGVMLGGGSTTVEFTQTRDDVSYGSLFAPSPAGGTASNHQASMTRTYVHLVPMINLEYALTQFILLRAGGGYSLSFGDTWTDRHGTDIASVPEKLNANGPTFQVGVFLGLFQQ